jgi:hypothetical protein
MEETFKLITKYLKRKRWEYDGTQYVFRTAEPRDSYIECEIDCILPKEGQSYTVLKFEYDLNTIMGDVYDMFGEKIAFESDFFVDGKKPEDVYLSNETKNKIRTELKSLHSFKRQMSDNSPINIKFSCDTHVFPAFNKKTYMESDNISLRFFVDISNLIYEDRRVTLKDSLSAKGKSWIESFMWDNDFAVDVADIFYTACESDFKFYGTDLFINASGNIRKIDGVDVSNEIWSGWGGDSNVTNLFKDI